MTANEKTILNKFREAYHITQDDHEKILKELDWNLDEFANGFRGYVSISLCHLITILVLISYTS